MGQQAPSRTPAVTPPPPEPQRLATGWPFPPKGGPVPMTEKQKKREKWLELMGLGEAVV